jgi:CheY-like chemotaxis protein
MSHEIRTPMHGIIGFSELALDDEVSLKTRNYINKIKASAESLLQIINDILDVSKIEAGKMQLEKTPFDISEVIKLCRVIVSPKAHEKGVTLYCYAEPSIGKLLVGDPTKLRQILLNLLSNAVKFTHNGIVKLLCAITNKEGNFLTMRFEVKDSGIGMTDEQIRRVFEPFVQGDDSTKRKFGGTGLGLTITKSFIEAMGGELKVESTPGIGSKFSFELTFEMADITEDIPARKAMPTIEEKPVFDGEVLVCEDNVLNQQVISDNLSKVGLRTFVAPNGRIGVDVVEAKIKKKEKPFDLIFMDIHMPEMDGLEAARRIIKLGCETPIVALTANIMSNDKEAYIESGMKDCMPKPFVANELWACLLKFLEPVSMSSDKEKNTDEEEHHRSQIIYTFVDSNKTTLNDIRSALAQGDTKLAHRLSHTLKGSAALVGMPLLSEAAMIIEQSIVAENMEYMDEKLKTLEFELNAAIKELTPKANEYRSKIIKDGTVDRQSAVKILENLDKLLEENSFDCLNYIGDLKMISGTEPLIKQVENFNFKQAHEILLMVKRHLESQDG